MVRPIHRTLQRPILWNFKLNAFKQASVPSTTLLSGTPTLQKSSTRVSTPSPGLHFEERPKGSQAAHKGPGQRGRELRKALEAVREVFQFRSPPSLVRGDSFREKYSTLPNAVSMVLKLFAVNRPADLLAQAIIETRGLCSYVRPFESAVIQMEEQGREMQDFWMRTQSIDYEGLAAYHRDNDRRLDSPAT
ncbi:hypothetical protein B0H12DRAFT_197393 [Mycena haematopus]|nr:hypothetical protein B0H12DRAFT_197393 [Mycena haematopus]